VFFRSTLNPFFLESRYLCSGGVVIIVPCRRELQGLKVEILPSTFAGAGGSSLRLQSVALNYGPVRKKREGVGMWDTQDTDV
jgi:hypothetical protein